MKNNQGNIILLNIIIEVLKKDENLITNEGNFLKNNIIEKAEKLDENLISNLFDNEILKENFFIKTNENFLFDNNKFITFINNIEISNNNNIILKNKKNGFLSFFYKYYKIIFLIFIIILFLIIGNEYNNYSKKYKIYEEKLITLGLIKKQPPLFLNINTIEVIRILGNMLLVKDFPNCEEIIKGINKKNIHCGLIEYFYKKGYLEKDLTNQRFIQKIEVAKLLFRFFDLTIPYKETTSFSDLKDKKFNEIMYIIALENVGIIKKEENNLFYPYKYITYGEFYEMIGNTLNYLNKKK